MNLVYTGPGLIEVLLFVAGLVAGILLRRRDGLAGLLLALGFGVQILGDVLSTVEPFLLDAVGADPTVALYGFSLLTRLISLAGIVLIFVGLLRLVRRRPAMSQGAAR